MSDFMNGLTLSELFYVEAAKPILESHFPEVPYSAALIGWGSEVLGYDDVHSTDHHWGPRFLLFLSESDSKRSQLKAGFDARAGNRKRPEMHVEFSRLVANYCDLEGKSL